MMDKFASMPYHTASYASTNLPETVNFQSVVIDPLKDFLMNVAVFIPDLLTAGCILLTGWIIGKALQFSVSMFLNRIGFDKFADKKGFTKLLSENNENIIPHRWLGKLTFWIVVAIAFILSLDQLHLNVASHELDRFLQFIVTIFIGLIIAILGMFFSFISYRVVLAMARNIDVKKPELYAFIAKWIVLIFTFMAFLIEIGLPPQIILIALGLVSVTLCITFIMAFGIGGVGWAGKLLEKTLK